MVDQRLDTAEPKRCAWVVLLMIGKAYAPGALVIAQSLRLVKTRHELVVMVTDDVPEETRAQLRLVFDRVVDIPYIEHTARRYDAKRQMEAYGGWMDRAFTKWNCLALTEYDKVILIDADMAAVANIDDLFDLPAPAACYSDPWAAPYKPDGSVNLYFGQPWLGFSLGQDRDLDHTPGVAQDLKSGGQGQRHGGRGHHRGRGRGHHSGQSHQTLSRAEIQRGELPHGARVPAAVVMRALNTPGAFVGNGGLVLLAPDAARHAALLAYVRAEPVFGAEFRTRSMSDEVAIAALYARDGVDWTHIHQRYEAVPWKKEWVADDIRLYHYLGRKPWDMAPGEWPDLADWWRVADALAAAHPSLRPLFYAAAADVGALDAEAAALRLTNDVRALLVPNDRRAGPASRRPADVDAALAAWLYDCRAAAGAAAGAARGRDQAPAVPAWPPRLYAGAAGAGAAARLASALAADRGAKPWGAAEAEHAAAGVVALVARRCGVPPLPSGAAPSCAAGALSYGSQFAAAAPAAWRDAAGVPCEAVVACAMRHAAAVTPPPLLTPAQAAALTRALGVAAEAYASPLAAVYPVCCGTQPDVDVPLGALPPFGAGGADAATHGWFIAFPTAAAAAADLDVALAAAARRPCVVAFRAGTAGVAAEKLRRHPLCSRGFRGAAGTEYFVVGSASEDDVAAAAQAVSATP